MALTAELLVGRFAVQLARAGGAHVIGTASAANLGLMRELGAHQNVDAATRFADALEPVDVVFDTAGGERLRRSLAARCVGRSVTVRSDRRVARPPLAAAARERGLGSSESFSSRGARRLLYE